MFRKFSNHLTMKPINMLKLGRLVKNQSSSSSLDDVVVEIDVSRGGAGAGETDDEHSLRLSMVLSLCSQELVTTLGNQHSALELAFEDLDVDNNGRVDRHEFEALFATAMQHNNLKNMNNDVIIPAAVDALMEDAGVPQGVDYVTKEQFLGMFERNPELMCCFEDEQTLIKRRGSVQEYTFDRKQPFNVLDPEEEQDNHQVWSKTTRWKNSRTRWIWTGLWILANIFAFTYKGIKYARRDEAMDVFGNCIIVARGSAQCLNLNCSLILLPVCRHFLTWLRATRLRFVIPFDSSLEYHIYIGMAIAVFTTTHVAAHICDFHQFAHAEESDIFALFGDKLGDKIPESKGGRWELLLSTRAGVTGIIMVVCILIAYPFTLKRREKFNSFWYTHHLLLIMILALCIHGTANLLDPCQSVYWVIFPLTLYFWRRLQRETPSCSQIQVLAADVLEDDIVRLKLSKPHSWDHVVKAGMYGNINIPEVSLLEWHPFTMTSAPFEDYIEFHFRKVGDWTSEAFQLVNNCATAKIQESDDEEKGKLKEESNEMSVRTVHPDTVRSLTVKLEGPIGASSQGFSDHPIVVLVGAGIGVTPMISVLKQLVFAPGRMKRTFFYWTTRDPANLKLFEQLVKKIYDSDPNNAIRLRHFLTSMKQDDRDLGSVLFHHATRSKHQRTNFDIVMGNHVRHQVEIGRPDWKKELTSIKMESKDLGYNDCGIFLCGPQKMADAIDDVSFDLSKADPNFHFYFTKETF
mmetsp:Transcript_11516/g.27865  ORF Transcript_11516/g.27865 Transcript_11516/m.27865 type:complete len:746 (-) Transcript_11516:24-2261(-)